MATTLPSTSRWRTLDRLIAPALFVLALLVYLTYGLQGEFRFDAGVYTYGAQQMLAGVPFYASVFDFKTPLSAFFLAGGMGLGRLFGLDDLLAARLTNLLFACLCVVAVYALGHQLSRSRRAGVFAALTFLTFFTFGMYAGSGPRAKTFMLLPLLLCFWWGARRQWFLSCVAGALAALSWQPAALAPLIMVVLAGLQTDGPARVRWRAVLIAAAGVLLPLLAIIVYFAAAGGLRAALEVHLVFNLRYIDRWPATLMDHFRNLIHWTDYGYHGQWPFIMLGLVMLIALVIGRARQAGGLGRFLAGDSLAALALFTPLFLIWSLVDYGSPTDLYPLLPAFAIGCGMLFHLAATSLPAGRRAFEVLLCLALVAMPVRQLTSERDQSLPAQRARAQQIEELLGPDGVLLTVGTPELLVLTGRTNPTRYIFLIHGLDNYINDAEPGGMAGWQQKMRELAPRVVVLSAGPLHMDSIPSSMKAWLKREYDKQTMGRWNVYVLRSE